MAGMVVDRGRPPLPPTGGPPGTAEELPLPFRVTHRAGAVVLAVTGRADVRTPRYKGFAQAGAAALVSLADGQGVSAHSPLQDLLPIEPNLSDAISNQLFPASFMVWAPEKR